MTFFKTSDVCIVIKNEPGSIVPSWIQNCENMRLAQNVTARPAIVKPYDIISFIANLCCVLQSYVYETQQLEVNIQFAYTSTWAKAIHA